jgi:osmoprotectant transport system permease protein
VTDTAAPPAAVPQVAPARPASRRIDRETLLMLTVPPMLVLLLFGAYVVWRQTADLSPVEASQLRWKATLDLMWEHTTLTAVSSALVVLIAVPLGVVLTRGRLRRLSPLVVGLIVLLAIWLGYGFWTGIVGLVLYGLLPVLRNTITGLQGVDPTLVEAGRGLGMSATAVLLRVELPLAVPVIMSGVRTALVLVVGTATLVTFINGGGLGGIINTGITLFEFRLMVAGAVLVAVLALTIEWLGRLLELITKPKGI